MRCAQVAFQRDGKHVHTVYLTHKNLKIQFIRVSVLVLYVYISLHRGSPAFSGRRGRRGLSRVPCTVAAGAAHVEIVALSESLD